MATKKIKLARTATTSARAAAAAAAAGTSKVVNVAGITMRVHSDAPPAKSGKGFAADAETLKNAATKPMRKKAEPKASAKARSAAAKRAEPTGTKKVATAAAKPATAPAKPAKGEPSKHLVRNVAGLIKILSTMPSAGRFDTDRKFGNPSIQVKNIRGRVIAEISQLDK